MSNQIYQFLPYPENKPTERKSYFVYITFGDKTVPAQSNWRGNSWDSSNVASFLAPVPSDPDDEKAAEAYATEYTTEPTGYGASFMKAGYKDGFLAGCAHKAGEVAMLRKQLEESLLLYNNMTHNITTLNAENERLKADNAKYGDMASALSKAGQEIERLRQALNQ